MSSFKDLISSAIEVPSSVSSSKLAFKVANLELCSCFWFASYSCLVANSDFLVVNSSIKLLSSFVNSWL